MALAKMAEDNYEIMQERIRYCSWTSRMEQQAAQQISVTEQKERAQ